MPPLVATTEVTGIPVASAGLVASVGASARGGDLADVTTRSARPHRHRAPARASELTATRANGYRRNNAEPMADCAGKMCLTFDFDAISVWPGMLGMTSPWAVSRGEFSERVAVPRCSTSSSARA